MDRFEFDIFLGGPPDRRSPFPYKAAIKEAFPELKIYDWEEYKGSDYQDHNDLIMKKSLIMVALVPDFPMPGIGPEIGYFYACHEERIEKGKEGLSLGLQPSIGVGINCEPRSWDIVKTDPINYVILIWPESVQPDFTKKTIGHYGLIVPTVEEAIAVVRSNLAEIQKRINYEREMEQKKILQHPDRTTTGIFWRKDQRQRY